MKQEKSKTNKALKGLKEEREGLTEKEAKGGLKKYGPNELEEKKKTTPFKVLIRQFKNFIVFVLIAAALISFFINEIINFWVITSIICFVIILGFFQEFKAEKAMEALKKIISPTSKVVRGKKVMKLLTKYIVPGDVLHLETGDKIPADGKIFEVIGLKVDESALTGESVPVEKKEGDIIFAGTQIVYGKCKALVTKTGMRTKLGEIAGMIQVDETKTPLQKNIAYLSRNLAILALVACTFTFTLGFFKGAPTAELLIVALALAVATVPEGLPLTLTLTLAHGMNSMAKHKAIVRKMLAVETLGSTTVICTDKTGTLTKNEMTVQKIWTDDKTFDITGTGYGLKGEFSVNEKQIELSKEKNLNSLLRSAVLCNNASVEKTNGKVGVIGDPTEASLIVAGAKANLWKGDLEEEYQRIEEIVFTSERKLMTTIYKKENKKIAFVKGAPEFVLEKCKFIEKNGGVEKLSKEEIAKILEKNRDFAGSAYRVLSIAYKKVSGSLTPKNAEDDLVFLGLVAMIDPPREEVKEAIEICKSAGIKTIMITGDNADTAKAVAKKIGLINENWDDNIDGLKSEKLKRIVKDGAITGTELNELSDKEFEEIVERNVIYARIMPEQKLRIVNALQNKGHVVAMTGDGVNDAPALKKADIGIAMGINGTDVAKESSVMILQDDNFATITEAIKRGRTIYENIEKFTCYLISRNFTEIILIILGIIFLGFEFLPLLALQILFINTFDEIMPSIALGLDPSRKGIMTKKPRKSNEKILKKRNLTLIILIASFMAISAFLIFNFNDPINGLEKARTLTFATIISMILFVPFAFRSLDDSILKIGFFTNKTLIVGIVCTILLSLSVMYIPFFQKIFELSTLSIGDWILPLSIAFSTLVFAEIVKRVTLKKF
jgi:P-type Ca2+ transporter type 2C